MAHAETETDDDLCWQIIKAVSQERGIKPTQIDGRLDDVVDIEAVERIVRRAGDDRPTDVSVSFPFSGCSVTVAGDGRVRANYTG